MSVQVTHVLSGDADQLLKAYQDLIARQEKQIASTRRSATENKRLRDEVMLQRDITRRNAQADRELNQLRKEGAKVIRSMQTPQERYRDELKKTLELRDKEVISQEVALRRYKQLKQEFREQTETIPPLGVAIAKNFASRIS